MAAGKTSPPRVSTAYKRECLEIDGNKAQPKLPYPAAHVKKEVIDLTGSPVHGKGEKIPGVKTTTSPTKEAKQVSAAAQDKFEKQQELIKNAGFTSVLKPHQYVGVQWMTNIEGLTKEARRKSAGGILADDMGLGKTIQALALIMFGYYLDQSCMQDIPPTLIVCPASIILQWNDEILKHTNLTQAQVGVYHTKKEREGMKTKEQISKFRIILTTYHIIASESRLLRTAESDGVPTKGLAPILQTDWLRVILDEGHLIRNPKGQISKAVVNLLRARRRWVLTGTPIHNSPEDMYVLAAFGRLGHGQDKKWWYQATNAEIEQWRKKYVLRRTKDILQLPPLTIHEHTIKLSEWEQSFYNRVAKEAVVDFKLFNMLDGRVRNIQGQVCITWILRLRQISNHPMLVLSSYEAKIKSRKDAAKSEKHCVRCDRAEEKGLIVITERKCGHIFCQDCLGDPDLKCNICFLHELRKMCPEEHKASAKILAILTWLKMFINEKKGEQVILYSQWNAFLSLLELTFEKTPEFRNVKRYRLDGTMSLPKRRTVIKNFQDEPAAAILCSNVQVGGLGLNLIKTRVAFMCDQWFTAMMEDQAFGRVHRIGQDHPVTCIRLNTNSSVDQAMMELIRRKRDMGKEIVEEGQVTEENYDKRPVMKYAELDSVFRTIINELRGDAPSVGRRRRNG